MSPVRLYHQKISIPFVLFLLMLVGLLFSRAILSISFGGWCLYILVEWKRTAKMLQHPLVIWSIAPLLLFVLGCWQQPFAAANYDYLLTLFMYPVAMLAALTLLHGSSHHYQMLWIGVALVSMLYPVGWYVLHAAAVSSLYGQGGSLPTFMDGDHLRFGLLLNSSLILMLSIAGVGNRVRLFIAFLLLAVILFMAVRTAWIAAFIIMVFEAFSSREKYLRKVFRITLLAIIPLFCIAYVILPTARQKINYTLYDLRSFDSAKYNSDFSDGTRRAINSVAWKAVTKDGSGAAGWAAIPKVLNQTFAKQYPQQQLNYGWPFNQWLFWWMGSGLLGMLLFSAWLLYPVYFGIKKGEPSIACWSLVIVASCFVECTLGLQYGVFLHVWPMALLAAIPTKQRLPVTH